ncbi:MraY family glycosyltransferase [Pedobacter psychroterrae]|uniref:Undecaprenyl/decaprenyl-phosphate alpha-N-acetylglucosaminyl 1-phosphate transferase n=1 Tax=Pedobacter psychroterrae TaxID=2530453 RepID=A0A4R0NPJ7_9SPHI|nr:MraY family glycosyltransferase [Pedobacter psychroterrae]TCD02716.1 undecaprenyl/decaprenyl-phosphate alpha-N-acetylglucosaminyl 1-phosphate transferase [Pedobacter psychroterrae]
MSNFQLLASLFLSIISFISVSILTPIIIWVSFQKRLVTPVNKRSSHKSSTPPFGGVAFYIIFIVLISFIQVILNESIGYNIIAATSILFMIGLKDDLVHSSAKVKLAGQVAAGLIVVHSANFRISFHGFFDNFTIHPLISILASVCLLILIINAYNLIDGIDGLAAMIGIVASSTYAWLFFTNNDLFFFLLSIITIGVLTAFLRFNLSKKNNKIFMGDCGSLTIGLIIGLLTLRFLAATSSQIPYLLNIEKKILFTTAVLFVPFLDTFRIIVIRIMKRQSPFKADKNHLHHVLLNYGLSHVQASLLLTSAQVSVLTLFYLLL